MYAHGKLNDCCINFYDSYVQIGYDFVQFHCNSNSFVSYSLTLSSDPLTPRRRISLGNIVAGHSWLHQQRKQFTFATMRIPNYTSLHSAAGTRAALTYNWSRVHSSQFTNLRPKYSNHPCPLPPKHTHTHTRTPNFKFYASHAHNCLLRITCGWLQSLNSG